MLFPNLPVVISPTLYVSAGSTVCIHSSFVQYSVSAVVQYDTAEVVYLS